MAASEKSADLKNMMVEVLSKCAVDIKKQSYHVVLYPTTDLGDTKVPTFQSA
jgi:hypothetical protein